jgi:ABC-type Fe3+ transport system substrate-binding protein
LRETFTSTFDQIQIAGIEVKIVMRSGSFIRGIFVCFVICTGLPLSAPQADPNAYPPGLQNILAGARKEQTINLRMQTQPSGFEDRLEKLFEERFGFQIQVQLSPQHPNDAQPVLIQEAMANKVSSDVYYSGDATAIPVKKAGAMQAGIDWLKTFGPMFPDRSRVVLKGMTEEMRINSPELQDSCLRWQDIWFAIVYNTDEIKLEDVPTTFDGLLNPKFKGRVAWMSSGFPIGEMANVFSSEYALDYAARLHRNDVILVQGGGMGVVEAVASGQATLGVTTHTFALMKKAQGAPVDAVVTKPDLVGFDFNFCVLNGPHRNLAQLFVVWLTTEARFQLLDAPYYYARISDQAGPIADVLKKQGVTREDFKTIRTPEAVAQREQVRLQVLKKVWAK